MINNQSVTAVIPVRAGSKRLPNKNILPFGDSNLLIHKIRQLKEVNGIDNIVVSSDSDEMLNMALKEGIYIHKRALEYADEKTKTFNEVVEHIASSVEGNILIWAPCVCPLTTSQIYADALVNFNKFVISKKEYDSVISAKLFKEYLFDEKGPINYNPTKHVPSQFLPAWKIIFNGFYIAKRQDMVTWKYLYGPKPYLQLLSKKESVDIDDEDDYKIAKVFWETK